MANQRGILNLIHSDAQRGAFTRHGNAMILNGAELLTEAQVRAQYVDREALTTRASIGVSDYTNLGKIDVQGTDTHAFMNKIYCNAFAKLDVGKTRMA